MGLVVVCVRLDSTVSKFCNCVVEKASGSECFAHPLIESAIALNGSGCPVRLEGFSGFDQIK